MKVVYTHTDEGPALATQSLLPILRAYAGAAGIELELRDISLAGRILAQFPERLSEEQRVADALSELGELAQTPEANIVKLPNISASVPQLKAAIAELQEQGYDIPDYPEEVSGDSEREVRARYDRVKGSAVNPVLRQGNSDRRAPESVKEYARRHPHRMGKWSVQSRSHVSTMTEGDFRSTEQSVTMPAQCSVWVELDSGSEPQVLIEKLALLGGEVIDASVMHATALEEFLQREMTDAEAQGVLFSVHLKATMMKVSDPIIFGHAVKVYFARVFEEHGDVLRSVGVDPADGLAALLKAVERLPQEQAVAVREAVGRALRDGPPLAMVDSDRAITNLHVPSDVIIDASMPAAIRTSGQMWNAGGEQQDTKFVIPDHSYAPLYDEAVRHCRQHGAFDPSTMGTTPNVGLMAQAAEEYGSHDKTFEIGAEGVVRVVDSESGETLMEHPVQAGDIWRMCQTKPEPIDTWVDLAVARARETGWPTVFWLDAERAHDREVLARVRARLSLRDTEGLDLRFMNVAEAARLSLERARAGKNTISVTGNVLRDYLTDLFPILELGTSAKMQSIVPLTAGGGLFETGAGGSAPKHVRQFTEENHLRWDSLGEFLALPPSFDLLAEHDGNPRARLLGATLDRATGRVLEEDRSPSRRTGELDNRGSHFYLALYWAQELAAQTEDSELASRFGALASRLAAEEKTIVRELAEVQGSPVDIGGYYRPDPERMAAAMRPSQAFNQAVDSL